MFKTKASRLFAACLLILSLFTLSACGQDDPTVKQLYQELPMDTGGNPNGSITVVDFFDYQCKYCKLMQPVLDQLAVQNPNVRIVYKDIAILGPRSEYAAKAAIASKNQGRYIAFHNLLISAKQPLTKKTILNLAKQAALDPKQLEKDIAKPETASILAQNKELAKTLKLNGTPVFFVGKTDNLHTMPLQKSGSVSLQEFNEMINKLN